MLTIRKIQTPVGDRRGALAAARYLIEPADSPQAFVREGDADVVPPRASSAWVGSEAGLEQLGLRRGSAVELEQLVSALQGQHAETGRQVRRPGYAKAVDAHGGLLLDEAGEPYNREVVNCWDLTFSAPKSVSALWALGGPRLRAFIEQATLDAAWRAVDFLVRTRPVVAGKEVADGFVAAASLHVTARPAQGEAVPSPQLHVHMATVGVVDAEGTLRSLESGPLYKRAGMRLGGAIGRATLARTLAGAGLAIDACSGRGRRYFEIAGVPRALREHFSGRARDVARWTAALEERLGGPVGSRIAAWGAAATRRKKARLPAADVQAVWDAVGAEHGFDRSAAEAMATGVPPPRLDREALEQQVREAVLERLWAEGPTVSVWQLQAIAAEQATRGLDEQDALALVGRMQADGELVVVDRWRVTSREIRAAERYVEEVAVAAAVAPGPRLPDEAVAAGITAAEVDLNGHALDREQVEAVELLTSGVGWACLTGRPGTGKGPVLQAVAEAHRRDGWQVIACAADGSTATDVAHLLGAEAMTLEQLRRRLELGSVTVDARTVVVMEEASKTGLRDWVDVARLCEQASVRVVAVGDAQQMGAVECPGMLRSMLGHQRIPSRRLREVRRHRDPEDPSKPHAWLAEYHAHLYDGKAADAIEVLQREDAIALCRSREDAMRRMVEQWGRRRAELGERYGVGVRDHAMVVYGTNADVDEVNRLAQAQRLEAGELGSASVEALDRGYRLHEGDVVMLRRASYQPARAPGEPRARRVENGTMGVIAAVDPRADRVRVAFDEPGGSTREVTVDMRGLRAQRRAVEAALAAGEISADDATRVPSLWLGYAGHPFVLQGKTFFAVSSLWGERFQRLVDVVSGDARAKSFLDVFFHLEGRSMEHPDEPPLEQMARQLRAPEHTYASIAYETRRERWERTGELVDDVPIVEAWPQSGSPPELALLDVAAVAHDAGVEPVRDPLRHHWRHLGPERLAAVHRRAEQLAEHAATLSDEALDAASERAEDAIARLDPHAALEVQRIERDRLLLAARMEAARERAEQLEARAEALREEAEGVRGGAARRELEDLLEEADARAREVAQDEQRLVTLAERERELHEADRHLDDWLAAEGETLARATAAERELVARRARDGVGPDDPARAADAQRRAAGPERAAEAARAADAGHAGRTSDRAGHDREPAPAAPELG